VNIAWFTGSIRASQQSGAKKSDRRICIARAAQLVFGDDTHDWLHAYRAKVGTRFHQASESDAGFFIVLRQLDDIAYQREMDARDIAAGRLPADISSREGGEEEEPWQESKSGARRQHSHGA
jgi:hypothetical protein